MTQKIHHISLVPVKILNQSLYYFSSRVSDLLNETQVTPRKNLGSKSRKNKDPSALFSYQSRCFCRHIVPLAESP